MAVCLMPFQNAECGHDVTIVMFSRTFYEAHSIGKWSQGQGEVKYDDTDVMMLSHLCRWVSWVHEVWLTAARQWQVLWGFLQVYLCISRIWVENPGKQRWVGGSTVDPCTRALVYFNCACGHTTSMITGNSPTSVEKVYCLSQESDQGTSSVSW